MREKYNVMRRLNFHDDLVHISPYIRDQLEVFVKSCKQERHDVAKKKVNKSYIPFSKNHIKVSGIKRGQKKGVAVFDPSTNMIVKQYTSLQSATEAAMLIIGLGFSCEISQLTPCIFKNDRIFKHLS